MNASSRVVSPAGAETGSDTTAATAEADIQVGTWQWDFRAGLFSMDPRWCHAMRVDPCEGADHLERWARAIHPDDIAEFHRKTQAAQAGRLDRFDIEYRVLMSDSRWLWLLQRGRVVERGEDGLAARITGICIEIDDRKRAEMALQENEGRLATALWGARAAFWQWHVSTDRTLMSPIWFAMTGYTREQWESLPNPWVARIHPEDWPAVQQQIRRHLAGELTSVEAEYRIKTATGDWKWMLTRGRAVEWDFDGKATSAIGVSLDIDAQKRAERELRSSEARLETAVWGAGMGLWEMDFRSENTRWFSDWCERLGLHPCDGRDHSARWNANVHPDDVAGATQRFQDHIAGKEDYYDAEYRIRDKSGRWRWLFERGRVVERDADGTALRMVGICMDVDDRKEGEIEYLRSQRRLEMALESARGGMWDWDVRTMEVRRTEFYYRLLGADPRVARATKGFWDERVHPDDGQRVQAAVLEVVEGRRELYEEQYRLRHENGSWRWVLDRGRVSERDADGMALRMVGFLVDITDRVRTQEALRESEATLRAVTENTPDWLFLMDGSLRVRFMNRPFGRYRPDDVIGHSLLEFVADTYQRELEELYRGVLATGQPDWLEVRDPNTNSTYEHRVAPIFEAGVVRSLSVAVNDVTERKRLEHEIIEIANREQQRIGSDLHDGLGQDLTGIALMLRGVAAQLRKEGSSVRLDIEDVIGLVNNAIESTRALARGLSPVSGERGGLTAALQTLASRATERYGVRVAFHAEFDEPLRLSETSSTHVYRIVQEALTNVMRHSRATEVWVRLGTTRGELQLAIEDNGRGFEQLPPDSPVGLGLKIMRYRAQMLGGDLLLGARTNGGASVRCTCPLDAALAARAREPEVRSGAVSN